MTLAGNLSVTGKGHCGDQQRIPEFADPYRGEATPCLTSWPLRWIGSGSPWARHRCDAFRGNEGTDGVSPQYREVTRGKSAFFSEAGSRRAEEAPGRLHDRVPDLVGGKCLRRQDVVRIVG